MICCDPTAQCTADISEYRYFGVHGRGKFASENTESSRPCPCIFEASPFRSDCESGSLWIKPQSLSVPKRVQQKLFTSPFICHSLQNNWNITSKEKLGTTLTTKLLQVCDFAQVNLHHHTQGPEVHLPTEGSTSMCSIHPTPSSPPKTQGAPAPQLQWSSAIIQASPQGLLLQDSRPDPASHFNSQKPSSGKTVIKASYEHSCYH